MQWDVLIISGILKWYFLMWCIQYEDFLVSQSNTISLSFVFDKVSKPSFLIHKSINNAFRPFPCSLSFPCRGL